MFGLLLLIRCDEVPAGLPCSCHEGAWWGGAGPAPGAPREVSAQVCNLVHEHRLPGSWCCAPGLAVVQETPGQVTGIRRVRSGQAKPFHQFPPALKNQKPGLDPNLPSPRLLGAGMGQGQGWAAAAGGVGRCLGVSQQLRASPVCAGWRCGGALVPSCPPGGDTRLSSGHGATSCSRG